MGRRMLPATSLYVIVNPGSPHIGIAHGDLGILLPRFLLHEPGGMKLNMPVLYHWKILPGIR